MNGLSRIGELNNRSLAEKQLGFGVRLGPSKYSADGVCSSAFRFMAIFPRIIELFTIAVPIKVSGTDRADRVTLKERILVNLPFGFVLLLIPIYHMRFACRIEPKRLTFTITFGKP